MSGENPYRPPEQATPLAVARESSQRPVAKIGWAWVLGTSMFAGTMGVVGRLVRPLISGPVHYEAIAGLALMIIACVVLLVRFRRFPRPQGVFLFITGTVAAWTAHAVGWMIAHGEIWDDVVWLNLASSAVAMLVGCVILLLPRRA